MASAENEGFVRSVRRDELHESPFLRRKNQPVRTRVTRPSERRRVLRQAKWATIVTDNEAQS